MTWVPEISLQSFIDGSTEARNVISADLKRRCAEFGFLRICDHGVPWDVVEHLAGEVKRFFSLGPEEKVTPRQSCLDRRGYIAIGEFQDRSSGLVQQCEVFKIYRGPAGSYKSGIPPVPENLWPQSMPELKEAVLNYWSALDEVRRVLLELFALALDVELTFFSRYFDNSMTNMTLLHYPPQPSSSGAYGASPHTDTDVLTILFPDPVGGLLIQTPDKGWMPMSVKGEEFIVNIGDMMEVWSGGHFRSTPHFVRNDSGYARYTFPYFAAPNPEVTVRPVVDPVVGFDNSRAILVRNEPEYVRAMSIGWD